MGSIRGLRSLMVVPALGIGLACTAILNPRDDVERCGASTDCEGTGDNRYVVECRFEEGIDSTEVDGVCVAEFKPQTCDVNTIAQGNMQHPLQAAYDQAVMSTRYICAPEQLGSQGCPTNAGACNMGLVAVGGLCDVPDSDSPARNIAGNEELDGQDVLDQFCRSYFCDESFVCDRESNTCVRCDEDRDFGFGGCGTVYAGGAPSCIYTDAEDACDAPDSNQDEPNFGDCTI